MKRSPPRAGLDAHAMDPAAVFASLNALGGTPPYTIVIGCEVESVDEGIGLSDAVAAPFPTRCGRSSDVVARPVGAYPGRRGLNHVSGNPGTSRRHAGGLRRTSSRSSTSRANTARSTSACCPRRPSPPATG